MEIVLFIVKTVVIIQTLLILLMTLLLYMNRTFFTIKEKWGYKKQKQTTHLMNLYFNEKTIPFNSVASLKKSIVYVLSTLKEMDKKYKESHSYPIFKKVLSQHVLRPYARKAAFSWNWYKRYIAASCYFHGIETNDGEILIRLIDDKSFLVATTATKCAIGFCNSKLVNALIDTYSKARHVRRSVYAGIIMQTQPDISSIIIERLQKETNPYVKAFCYQLLSRLSKEKHTRFPLQPDLESDSVELKIAVLKYISYLDQKRNNKMIYHLSEDSDWQVRAIAAKALGKLHSEESIPFLEKLLKDTSKWVKTNAAYSLMHKGKKGKAILEKQTPEVDEVAYDIAQEMLRVD